MATDGTPALTRLSNLTREAVETQARLGREYAELTRSTWSNENDRVSAGQAYLDSVRRESERYWRAWSELGLGYAEEVVKLGTRAGAAVVRDVRSAVKGSVPEGSSVSWTRAAGDEPVETTAPGSGPQVSLNGPLGSTATARVTVANQHPRARRIALTAGPLSDSLGELVDAELEADPSTVTVPAGEESQVTLSVNLDAKAFAAGQDYTATVEVSGGAEARIAVLVHVDLAL